MLGVVYAFCVYLGGIFIYGAFSSIKQLQDEAEKKKRQDEYFKRQHRWELARTLS
jgi:hypothetical protein